MLDKTKLRETDLIYTLLAEDGRQIRAVGKGARKPGSRLAARCDLACDVDLLLAHGRSLDIVSEASLIEAPLGASPGYALLSAASAVIEVAKTCSFEDAEDPFVYPITNRALEVLGGADGAGEAHAADAPVEGTASHAAGLDGAHLDLIVAAYVFKLLSHMGYRPDYAGCVLCGDEAVSYFSASAGGLLCASCASSVPGAEPVDATTVAWLRALMAARFDELAQMPVDPGTATMLAVLAHGWAATHLDARLRSLEFLLGC